MHIWINRIGDQYKTSGTDYKTCLTWIWGNVRVIVFDKVILDGKGGKD